MKREGWRNTWGEFGFPLPEVQKLCPYASWVIKYDDSVFPENNGCLLSFFLALWGFSFCKSSPSGLKVRMNICREGWDRSFIVCSSLLCWITVVFDVIRSGEASAKEFIHSANTLLSLMAWFNTAGPPVQLMFTWQIVSGNFPRKILYVVIRCIRQCKQGRGEKMTTDIISWL